MLFPCEMPVNGDYAWINQGTATIDATYGPPCLQEPTDYNAHNQRVRIMSAPSTPYTIDFLMLPFITGYSKSGFTWRESSSGKLIHWQVEGQAGYSSRYGNYTSMWKMTDASTYNSAYAGALVWYMHHPSYVWFRAADDGVNREVSVSVDGINWVLIHQVGRTDFLTADQVGFVTYTNNVTNADDSGLTVLSWKEG